MCSDPQEFIHKETGEVFTVACRKCDECIATRRHCWVARAMAEKSDHPHTLCIALTYSDDTPESRAGAQMFCYADVRAFMKRLLSAARYEAKKGKWGVKPYVRFLCAGEQGSRNGRCHWHMILYSNVDLLKLGKFFARRLVARQDGAFVDRVRVTERRDMMSVGKRKIRLNWTLWEHGFMTVQEPDQGGMNYVLSYCLKDQFTHEKSQGTAREAVSEPFATGLFRMSKRPAIGEAWFYRKMERLDASGSVLPALRLTVPGFRGYWVPSGSFRKKLLWALVALNKRVLWSTGANAPQWAALLSACSENESDLKVLHEEVEQEDLENDRPLESAIAFRGREVAASQECGKTVNRCGGVLPCWRCLNSLSVRRLDQLSLERFYEEAGQPRYRSIHGAAPYEVRRAQRGDAINPDCQLRIAPAQRKAFPASAGE